MVLNRVAAIDLDNTVTDTLECQNRLRESQGLPPLVVAQSWEMSEYSAADQAWCQTQFNSPDYIRSLRDFPGARQRLWWLSEFYELVYITSRPKHLAEVTMRWQIEHDFPRGTYIFSERTPKGKLLRERYGARMAFLVDDSPETARSAVQVYGIPTYLIDYPYNREVPEHELLTRADDLVEVAWYRIFEEGLPYPALGGEDDGGLSVLPDDTGIA